MLLLSVQVYFVTNVELIIPVTLSLHVVFDSFVKGKRYKLKLCCVILNHTVTRGITFYKIESYEVLQFDCFTYLFDIHLY